MITKRDQKIKKSKKISVDEDFVPALPFLEQLTGGPLTLGEAISAIRECDEIKQVDFAKKLGVSKSYLSDLENNRKEVSPKKAAEFARILSYPEKFFIVLALRDMLARQGLHYKIEVRDAA